MAVLNASEVNMPTKRVSVCLAVILGAVGAWQDADASEVMSGRQIHLVFSLRAVERWVSISRMSFLTSSPGSSFQTTLPRTSLRLIWTS